MVAVALVGVLAAGLAGCRGKGGEGGTGAGDPAVPQGPQLAAAVTAPAADATDVQPIMAVSFTTEQADRAEVAVVDGTGRAVPGKLTADGKRWVPSAPLRWGTKYTATVTATGADGKTATADSAFTVMRQPATLVNASSHLGDGAVVGVGMPLMIRFGRAIPEARRDDVQRRMTVTASPAQVGTWSWQDGQNVHYRPKVYWRAGTRVTYRVATRGLSLGGGWYGGNDLSVRLTIGASLIMTVDNKTKSMTVTKNGRVVRKMPVSLGKPKTPTSTGTMLIMDRLPKTVFDTRDELSPDEAYVTKIDWAQRLTWGGEFIHSAPWSVADQGKRNVSHGCVNLSPANAKWLFDQTKIGDVVTIRGTEVRLQQGNGWTDWNTSWAEYAKGSALPVAG
ncbi:hypothetical protein GCM10010123_40310 [Pilimelia anulata]|uniref:L,D-TPase catalytic domain-containing protein n=1 Tax=Pilimelia anulata TaxID=53371 RepID=A0A8J3BF98_9ACTN|nr:Ig-like domain-containing protein [Pilimelia anulata]GGK06426.1 hypothetical protein GCM10010123_40310 [Pilimelia anulata]